MVPERLAIAAAKCFFCCVVLGINNWLVWVLLFFSLQVQIKTGFEDEACGLHELARNLSHSPRVQILWFALSLSSGSLSLDDFWPSNSILHFEFLFFPFLINCKIPQT